MQAILEEPVLTGLRTPVVHTLSVVAAERGGRAGKAEGRIGDRMPCLYLSHFPRHSSRLQTSQAHPSTRQGGAPEAMPQHGLPRLPRLMHPHRILPAGQTRRTPGAADRPGLRQHTDTAWLRREAAALDLRQAVAVGVEDGALQGHAQRCLQRKPHAPQTGLLNAEARTRQEGGGNLVGVREQDSV